MQASDITLSSHIRENLLLVAGSNLKEENQVRVSKDGKGQALDNIITERFFQSLKYDDICINEYSTPSEMIAGVKEYMYIYNTIRPHSSLDGLTPNEFCQRAKQIAA
jgi:putative transposase